MPDTEIETGNWKGVEFSTHIVLQSNDTKPVEYAVLREAAEMSGVPQISSCGIVASLTATTVVAWTSSLRARFWGLSLVLARSVRLFVGGSVNNQHLFVTTTHALFLPGLIKDMLEDQEAEEQTMIPLPNVSGKTMKYVIQYMEHHVHNKAEPIEKPLKVCRAQGLAVKAPSSFLANTNSTARPSSFFSRLPRAVSASSLPVWVSLKLDCCAACPQMHARDGCCIFSFRCGRPGLLGFHREILSGYQGRQGTSVLPDFQRPRLPAEGMLGFIAHGDRAFTPARCAFFCPVLLLLSRIVFEGPDVVISYGAKVSREVTRRVKRANA